MEEDIWVGKVARLGLDIRNHRQVMRLPIFDMFVTTLSRFR
jgi:hypothetical protein